ncbi:fluoride efflux transporter FluC [Bifidobacterium magnum]|uniref:Fluoride-specific ion channel FluC n=1 Tax=Bifidobacterium magnum TaxID=1692 RepID=A0A087BAR3_9BIFI|nr:CrcB family protein [Bifidobacterium magnum]KFI68113.1 CrcB-like protein [Bifidobacterium magnum]
MTFLLVCLCGGLGSVCRFMLNTSIQRWWNNYFPLATLMINCFACFFAGIALQSYVLNMVPYSTYMLFVAGFLGGLSTYSTMVNEVISLAHSRHTVAGIIYAVVSLVLPLLSVVLGWWLGSLLVH